jgi:hypothetical protein
MEWSFWLLLLPAFSTRNIIPDHNHWLHTMQHGRLSYNSRLVLIIALSDVHFKIYQDFRDDMRDVVALVSRQISGWQAAQVDHKRKRERERERGWRD